MESYEVLSDDDGLYYRINPIIPSPHSNHTGYNIFSSIIYTLNDYECFRSWLFNSHIYTWKDLLRYLDVMGLLSALIDVTDVITTDTCDFIHSICPELKFTYSEFDEIYSCRYDKPFLMSFVSRKTLPHNIRTNNHQYVCTVDYDRNKVKVWDSERTLSSSLFRRNLRSIEMNVSDILDWVTNCVIIYNDTSLCECIVCVDMCEYE